MRALVVGGAGFLGTNLVHRLCRDAHEVTVVDSLTDALHSTTAGLTEVMSKIRFLQLDTRDTTFAEVVRDQDVIFTTAGQTSHPISMQRPDFDIELNCTAHIALLEAVRKANRDAVVVYTSTSTVVGKATRDIIDEDHPELPLDIYSANKLAAEKYYRIYHTAHGLKTISLRFANLFGAYGKGRAEFGFMNFFIHQAWTDAEIKIFGAGDQMRNVLYAEDAADIMVRAAEVPALYGRALFATHDEHVSVRGIAEQIVETFGRGKLVQVEWPAERKAIEVDNVRISAARLRELTGWSPRYSFRAGLQETKRIMERTAHGRA